MRRSTLECNAVTFAVLALFLASPARGQDRAPNPNPANATPLHSPGPPPPDLRVGPLASPSAAARALSEEDVEAIVERVVARQTARQTARGSAIPPEGWQQPDAPSAQYQGPVAMPYPSAQSRMVTPANATPLHSIAVLVPAGPISTAMGHLGSRLATLGQPRIRTYRVATPAAIVATQPVYATGQQ